MNPGESAAAEAARARAVSERLRRKADHAAHVADNYAKGAEGERIVAAAVAPLEQQGWHFLHDRRGPFGGNIDHLAIGPPGVAILDAKRWTAPATITVDRRLVSGKDDHSPMIERLNETIEFVRAVLRAEGARVAVRGCVVMTSDGDRGFAVRDLGDIRVLGVDGLVAELQRARGDLSASLVDAIAERLATEFPSVSAPLPPPPSTHGVDGPMAPSALFEKAQRFYYLRAWKKGGHHRLYLRNSDGETLGWTDVSTNAVSIECQGDEARFAEVLLAAADPTGMKLTADDLPKVATQLRGGRLLSRVARLHTSVLVGQEWRRYDKHRLYGTLIDPSDRSWNLGHIDLKTRTVHPSSSGPLSKERGPAEDYLKYLLYKMPPEPAKAKR